MAGDRLKGTRYMVFWRARVLLQDRVLREGIIEQVCLDGFHMRFEQAVHVGAAVNVEFYVKYKGKQTRLRAKTKTIYCMVLASNQGAELDLRLTFISDEDKHVLNNILQILENSSEFNLRT